MAWDTLSRLTYDGTREDVARIAESINREAENAAREHRLDIDRVILAGLTALESVVNRETLTKPREDWDFRNDFLRGYAGTTMTTPMALLAEIRAGLSPLALHRMEWHHSMKTPTVLPATTTEPPVTTIDSE